MLDNKTAQGIIEKVTGQTKHYAQIRVMASEQGTTRFAKSEINQNVQVSDTNVVLTVFDGKKEATASTNVLTDAGLAQLTRDAEALLAHVPPGEYEAFPLPKDDVKNEEDIISHQNTPGALAKKFGITERAALIKEGVGKVGESRIASLIKEDVGKAEKSRIASLIQEDVGYVESSYSASGALVLTRQAIALGDSHGAFRFAAYDDVAFNTVVTSDCGADGAAEACSYTTAPDIPAQFIKAYTTAKAARNVVVPTLGAHTVVLSPVAFGDLMQFLTMMHNAKSVDDGFSYAAGKMGEKVFGVNLTVRDDCTHPELRPLRFDFEGNPRKPLTLIENGVIRNFLYDNKRAAKHGVAPTGHAVQGFGGMTAAIAANIIVEAGDMTMEEIIASTPRGIFINEFHYTNFVNPRNLQITGLTRNGAFLIEDGKITSPISTVRFTESLLNAFNNITAVSCEQEKVSGMGIKLMPGVRIENFHFTSKA